MLRNQTERVEYIHIPGEGHQNNGGGGLDFNDRGTLLFYRSRPIGLSKRLFLVLV